MMEVSMPVFPDLAALLLLLLGTAISAALLWRKNIRGWSFFSMAWLAFYGLVLSSLMLGHCTEILYQTVARGMAHEGTSWTYDFRFYSLELLGALLIWCGIRYLWAAMRLSRGEVAGLRIALGNTLVVLAIVAPLIPIQTFFAVPLTAFGVLTLFILKLIKPRYISGPVGVAKGRENLSNNKDNCM